MIRDKMRARVCWEKFISSIVESNRGIVSNQNHAKQDSREALHVKWLTYNAQKQNYDQWDDTCVELGFARWATEEQEQENAGSKIVFFDGQVCPIL
jgi:hypothetical protein